MTEAQDTSGHVDFVQHTVGMLVEHQSARLGGAPDGVRFITVTRPAFDRWVSLGSWQGDRYSLLEVPAKPVEPEPTTADMDMLPVLDQLTELTGEPRYRRMAERMAAAFAQWGFDPASGLLHVGAMSRFDVVAMGPVGVSLWDEPHYKPGGDPPMDWLWRFAPHQTARFARATFHGLVTRPETMDYNRYVHLGWSDRLGQPAQPFSPSHRGFLLTGALLIKYWAMEHVRSGDPQTLEWAQRMADKWQNLQHPETGLLPHFIGAIEPGDMEQSPTPYAEISDVRSAVEFLEAARILEDASSAEAHDLAGQLRTMGTRKLRGIANHGYDAERRLFRKWLRLEGGEYTGEAFYTFRTQADKDAALERDPRVSDVAVFEGYRFFESRPSNFTAGTGVPAALARGAELTGDQQVIDEVVSIAETMLAEARARTGPINNLGQLTYAAGASYIRMLLSLHRTTGDARWLAAAEELAQQERALLAQLPDDHDPTWWRLPQRTSLLKAMLDLEQARRAR